jgi:putative restriction endonuclease
MVADRTGVKWNREETILAYYLYCQIPFGKLSKTNDRIIELASLLGRTPSSVALKIFNLAHHDSKLIEQNVVAMAHGSKLDKEISDEFNNDWGELSFQAGNILTKFKENVNPTKVSDNVQFPYGGEYDTVTKARINQSFFRNAVLATYNNKCCITGVPIPELLIASHIKPWSASDEKTERVNPCNGISLNAFHDSAFDQGFITIDKNYIIRTSSEVQKLYKDGAVKDLLLHYENTMIELPQRFIPEQSFLEYHNDVIFRG